MTGQFKISVARSPSTHRISCIQITPSRKVTPSSPGLNDLQLVPKWSQLRETHVTWRKRGWYLLKGHDGSLYYQCVPSADDRLQALLDLDEDAIKALLRFRRNRSLQFQMLDESMYCEEEMEETFVHAVWEAVALAIKGSLLVMEEFSSKIKYGART